jgi:membrane-bound lytic murein transglycosylase B
VIPRGYPQVPTRVKLGLAPWFALAVIGLGVLSDHGVIDLHASPPTTRRPPAASRDAGGRAAPAPSRVARAEIPADYLTLYRASARSCPGLPWGVLAGIGKVETNHGRSGASGVRSGVNAFGCCAGPMQFNIRNGPPSTWDRYGRGGNVYDPQDAIPAAARLLCANGARGGRDLRRAVYTYNHAWSYVAQVLTLARAYQAGGQR